VNRRVVALAAAALALAGAALLLAVALTLAGCGGEDDKQPQGEAPRMRSTASAAGRTQAPLTAEQLAGQHVVFPFAGRTPPRALLTRIRRGETAGVIFLGSNLGTPAQVRALTRTLRRVPRPAGLRARAARPPWRRPATRRSRGPRGARRRPRCGRRG
jgi:hypothetical protein